jgi:RNA polymerase sigma-70 factor (ECF subfamily)
LNNQLVESDISALIAPMTEGNTEAFRVIYEQLQGKVFAYALRFTKSREPALDMVQRVFIKIWEKRAAIDPQGNFEGYLMRTTQHLLLNLLRDTARDQAKKEQLYQEMQRLHREPEEYVLEKELSGIYYKAIEALSPQKKTIYGLRNESGLSYAEIAEQLGISPLTVKKHMAEAVKLIREYVQTHHEIGFILVTGALHSGLF